MGTPPFFPGESAKELKTRLASGDICFGAAVTLSDPCATEILCGAGYDFLSIDTEHAPHDRQDVQHHLIAAAGTGTPCVVRVAWNHPGLIKQAMDMGAAGIIVPMVKGADDVRDAVSACLYPPAGQRGFGPRRASGYGEVADYPRRADESVIVWAQIEQVEAADQIHEIINVPGLSGLFIGRNDLSGSMGILGEIRHPRVNEAMEEVIAAAQSVGLPVGMGGPVTDGDVTAWAARGMRFFMLGGDWGFLRSAAHSTIQRYRGLI